MSISVILLSIVAILAFGGVAAITFARNSLPSFGLSWFIYPVAWVGCLVGGVYSASHAYHLFHSTTIVTTTVTTAAATAIPAAKALTTTKTI